MTLNPGGLLFNSRGCFLGLPNCPQFAGGFHQVTPFGNEQDGTLRKQA